MILYSAKLWRIWRNDLNSQNLTISNDLLLPKFNPPKFLWSLIRQSLALYGTTQGGNVLHWLLYIVACKPCKQKIIFINSSGQAV